MSKCTCNRQQFQGHSGSCAIFFPQPIQGEADQLHDKVQELQADLATAQRERDEARDLAEARLYALEQGEGRAELAREKAEAENARLRAALEELLTAVKRSPDAALVIPILRAEAALRGEGVPSKHGGMCTRTNCNGTRQPVNQVAPSKNWTVTDYECDSCGHTSTVQAYCV